MNSEILYTNLLTGEEQKPEKNKIQYALSIFFAMIMTIAELAFTIWSFYIAITYQHLQNDQACLVNHHIQFFYAIGAIEIISTIVNVLYFFEMIVDVSCFWDSDPWLTRAITWAKFMLFLPLFSVLVCNTGLLYQSMSPTGGTCKTVYPAFYKSANMFTLFMWTKFGGFLIGATGVTGLFYGVRLMMKNKNNKN